jgi:hypothetical protein
MPVERFLAPTAGISLESAPTALTKTEALELENLLTDRVGKVVLRGPLGVAHSMFGAAALFQHLSGVWRFGRYVMLDSFGTSAHTRKRWAADDLLAGGTNVAHAVTGPMLGRSVRVGDFAYGVETSFDPFLPAAVGRVLRWAGGTAEPVPYTSGPRRAQQADGTFGAIAAHLERVFIANADAPGAPGVNVANGLFWSDVGGPVTDAAASWQDNVSGLVNQIRVGSAGDPITGLASMSRQLVIFKNSSIYAALGDSPSNFTVRRVTNTLGCSYPGSILVFNDICVFLSRDELILYDGTTFTPLGRPPGWTAEVAWASQIEALPNDYLLVSDGRNQPWLFHLPTRAWVQISAPATVLGDPQSVDDARFWLGSNERGDTVVMDEAYIREANALTPRDLPLGTTFGRDAIRTDPEQYELIAGRWKTRVARLSLPFSKAAVRRVSLDHNTKSDGADSTLPEWNVDIKAADGTSLFSTNVEAAADAGQVSMRATEEVNAEANEITVETTYQAAGTPAQSTAELHDVWVEYEPAQKQAWF